MRIKISHRKERIQSKLATIRESSRRVWVFLIDCKDMPVSSTERETISHDCIRLIPRWLSWHVTHSFHYGLDTHWDETQIKRLRDIHKLLLTHERDWHLWQWKLEYVWVFQRMCLTLAFIISIQFKSGPFIHNLHLFPFTPSLFLYLRFTTFNRHTEWPIINEHTHTHTLPEAQHESECLIIKKSLRQLAI